MSCDSTALLFAAATSCTELYERGLEDSTYVTIDADGSGSNEPFTAYCERNGSTVYTIIRTYLYIFVELAQYSLLSALIKKKNKNKTKNKKAFG